MPSLALSSALVASSRRRMRGPRTIARAMHTRCRCPPDSCVVVTDVPARVSYFSVNLLINSSAFAARAAACASHY